MVNEKHNWEKTFYWLTGLFFLVFFSLSYGKFNAFSTLQDLPYYTHAIWYTAHGKILYTTISTQGYNTLGNHMTPILLFLTPFFWVSASSLTLLFFQSAALALGAVPVFWFSRDRLNSNFLGFLVGLAYLFHPTVWYNNLNDFHVTPFGAMFAGFGFYFLSKNQDKKSILFILLLILCKEDLILLGISFGLYMLFVQKKRILGVLTSAISAAYFVLSIKVLMPFFSRNEFISEQFYVGGRYGYLGGSLGEMAVTIITDPFTVIAHVLTLPKLLYLFMLFFPAMFLSILAPEILFIAGPTFAVNLLSTYLWQSLITTQYSMVIVPFLYFGAAAYLRKFSGDKLRKMCMALLFFSVLSNLAYGPPPQGAVWKLDIGPDSSYRHVKFLPDDRVETARDFTEMIPPDASVLASPNLVPHIPMRTEFYLPIVEYSFIEEKKVDYVFLDTESYMFGIYPDTDEMKKGFENYEKIGEKNGYILFKRS